MRLAIAGLAFAGIVPCSGNFLAKDPSKAKGARTLSQEVIEKRFLEEVRGLSGKGPADLQIPAIKAALEPMWLAMPKNSYGGLDNAQVKYALHRLFVQRHGWHIDGLSGSAMNNTVSPVGIMQDRVPAFLMELFEEAFGTTGLKLEEMAIFAGTLERLIHDETVDSLKQVYAVLGVSTDAMVDEEKADLMMQIFMASQILGPNRLKDSTMEKAQKDLAYMTRGYPAWAQAKIWLKEKLQKAVQANAAASADVGFDFKLMEHATEEAAMGFGGFLDSSCMDIKTAILESEEKGSGRVLLTDFYKKGKEKGMLLSESPTYLRQLGALDESRAGEPRVIVANYMTAPSNCLVEAGFYNVCCLNQCEGVMSQLEKQIGAPQATPARIVEVISGISTSTTAQTKALPQALVSRLQSAADRNGGSIPLYGRLFAQWLHFVFPRECPFPHTAGSTNPQTPSDYAKATSEKSTLKTHEMDGVMDMLQNTYKNNDEETVAATGNQLEESEEDLLARWSDEEEVLFLPTEAPRSVLGLVARASVALAVLGGLGVAAMDGAKRVLGDMDMKRKVLREEKMHIF